MGRHPVTSDERARGERLGKFIAARRQARSVSQAALASAADVDLDSLRGMEQGRYAHPSFFSIAAILAALDTPRQEALDGIVDEPTP